MNPYTCLVSACLVGRPCRYDGKTKLNQPLMARLAREQVLAVCPEQLGGLATPRPACRLVGGNGADVLAGRAKVLDILGMDRTTAFLQGARLTLEMAMANQIRKCCLKAKSPSCGSGRLVQTLEGKVLPLGYRAVLGVTAALLLTNGMDVEEIP